MARFGGTAVTDAGRDAATDQLREHYAAGRLSPGRDPFKIADRRAALARTGRRIMLALGVLTAGSLLFLALLVTALLVRGGLLAAVAAALLAILAVGVAAVAALAWVARRLWRRHAWIEAVPSVSGQPWLSLVARMARLLFTGRALWRLRARLASRA